jgi:pSer/pThr/pTyr-binding forkhead associated (FHA) protein
LTGLRVTDRVERPGNSEALAVFKLTIEDDEGKTTVVPLSREETTIGRLDGNTIRLTERNVSRKHARLVRQNGAIYIEDLASFTGVRVNGTRIAALTPLREGDEVQIGDYKLALKGDEPGAAIGDRPTVPTMAAVGPMATVGGSVAIPTRGTAAAMSAQPAQAMAGPATITAPLSVVRPTPAAAQPAPPPASALDDGAKTPGPVPPPQSPRRTSPPALPGSPPALPGAVTRPEVQVLPPAGAGDIPEVFEAQPTIPLRAMGTETVADRPVPVSSARLFVVSTDLAGREVALDRASLVIGRTEENDIVLGHRSISRHHAKIVRDGDSYTIVDLQSANGVRVNGEDYERIELHAGDIIELGHVKLRFVGADEKYVFDPNADFRPRRQRSVPVKHVALGAGLLSLLVVIGLMRRTPHNPGELTQAHVQPPPAQVAAPTAPPPAPPPVAEPTPQRTAPEGNTPAGLLAEAQQAVAVEDWERARAAIDRMGSNVLDPIVRRDAQVLRRRVDAERLGAMAFAEFDEAANTKNYVAAMARYDQIPADSVYKRRAKARYEEARTLLVADHLASAEQARAAGRCNDVRTEVAAVARLDPKNMVGREMVRLCRPARPEPPAPAPVVAARPARPRPSPGVAVTAVEPAPRAERASARAESAEEAADPDALMKQARESWMRQQCGAAIDLSRRALKARPGMTDAYQIVAVCSCTLKDAEAANRAYLKLDDKNRSLVRSLCQRNGIALGD